MIDMVERVARVLESKLYPNSKDESGECLEMARAAIKAMREPTDAMVGSVEDAYDGLSALTVQYVWSAMIDAALGENG